MPAFRRPARSLRAAGWASTTLTRAGDADYPEDAVDSDDADDGADDADYDDGHGGADKTTEKCALLAPSAVEPDCVMPSSHSTGLHVALQGLSCVLERVTGRSQPRYPGRSHP